MSANESGNKIHVGGQAVVEGVMMRSPRSFAVVCRNAAGSLVVKEQPWRSVWERFRFLRWPFLRGGVVLAESLVNGMSALTFSAKIQAEDEAKKSQPEGEAPKASAAESAPSMAGLIIVSVLFALGLFVGLPHLLTALIGFSASSLSFHLVDGAIKVVIFVGYIAAIGLLPDIRRVFMYHGAEHKAIYTYEAGLPLEVENARKQTRLHPRCGTSFLFIVIMISIVLFAITLRYPIMDNRILDHLVKILIKVPLMFPVAGLSYEVLKLSAKFQNSILVRALVAPGLWLQRLTTREPTDDQLEVALIAIEKTLWREQQDPAESAPTQDIETYPSFEAARTVLS